jgi:CPA2 family monovalent cation:H+ antiporter-2
MARKQWVQPIPKKDHVIIAGFGVVGRNLARAARLAGIDYVVADMNPETVRDEQRKGEPIFYGDAAQEMVLEHAAVHSARIVVVAVNDPAGTRRITEVARRMNPGVHTIVRTRYLQEVEPLYKLGAEEVVPEEYEASVEVFTRVLAKYLVPRMDIESYTTEIRASGYEMFRSLSRDGATMEDLKGHLPELEISSLRLREGSSLVGKTLADSDLRKNFSVTVLAVRRNKSVLANPSAETVLHAGDILIVLGKSEEIIRVGRDCETCKD